MHRLTFRPFEFYFYVKEINPLFKDFRSGDVRHSLADITRAKSLLGYQPHHRVTHGLIEALTWYINSNISKKII